MEQPTIPQHPTDKQIKAFYKKRGWIITPEEISIIQKAHCECYNCRDHIFEMRDFPTIKDNDIYCERCDYELHYSTCPICEEYYEKPIKPIDHVLIISKEAVKEYGLGIIPGFYQVKKYPYFYGDCVTGFDGMFNDALELIKEVDINSMLYKLYPHNGENKVTADSCCNDCMRKYTGQKELINNYANKRYGAKRIVFEKKVIKERK